MLERAVFLVQYRQPRQRLLRWAAGVILFIRHGLRGLLYVWPLTLVLFLDLPGPWAWLRIVLALLAGLAFQRYVLGSIRDDYARFVGGRLHDVTLLRRIL